VRENQTTPPITKDEKRKNIIKIVAISSAIILFTALTVYLYQSQQKYIPPPPEPKIELHGKKDLAKDSWIAQSAQQMQEQKKQLEETQAALKALTERLEKSKETSEGKGFPPGQPPVPGQSEQPPVPGQSGQQPQIMFPPPPTGQVGAQGTPTQPTEKVLTNLIAMEENSVKGKDIKDAKDKEKKEEVKTDSKSGQKKDKDEGLIPAGSFIKTVLMTGIDAPSGAKGKGSPYPVLLKVYDLAQLPNKWRSDIEGCFIVGEAYGELSSERVHIRVNTLSCVSMEGEIISGSLSGYVVGEDGKTGLSGMVVTKQGAILSRSLITGFLQGVSQAFSQSATVLNVTPTGNVSTIDPSKSLQAGMGTGATRATEELAKFYMEMAKEMFPVIEVNAGRKVEVVITQKVTLSKRS